MANAGPVSKFTVRSIMAFGAIAFVSSLAGALWLDSMIVDLGAVVVLALLPALHRGSRKAAMWLTVFMACYLFVAGTGLASCILRPSSIELAGRPLPARAIPWLMVILAIFGAWAAVNLMLLLRAGKKLKARTQPDARPPA